MAGTRGRRPAPSLAGIGIAALALLPYAVGGLGAGDVKLLMAIGALMGPVFVLWTGLGSILTAGVLGLGSVAHSVLVGRVGVIKNSRMPMAPAIALGALFAYWHLHGGLEQ